MVLTLVVDARDIGLGRLLAVEADVLDRGLAGPADILAVFASTCNSVVQKLALRSVIIT